MSRFGFQRDVIVKEYLNEPEDEPKNDQGLFAVEFRFDTVINHRWRAQALPSVRAHTLGNDIHRIDTTRFGFSHEGAQTTGGRTAEVEFNEDDYAMGYRDFDEDSYFQGAAAASAASARPQAGILIRNFVELRPPPHVYIYRHGARFHMLPNCSRDPSNPRSISEGFSPCQNCCRTERFEQ